MTRMEEFRDLFGYHRWANGRVLDATAALPAEQFDRDLGNSFGSIRGTLVHMLGADWVWLSRWTGTSPKAFPDWDVSTHALLRERWREIEGKQKEYLDGLGEADVDRVITYTLFAGTTGSNPLGELMRHVVNHSTYHRGQVVTMLRQLKAADPPHTDLIVYYRGRG
jgi:uncharacterized damage-inducible protein DinB